MDPPTHEPHTVCLVTSTTSSSSLGNQTNLPGRLILDEENCAILISTVRLPRGRRSPTAWLISAEDVRQLQRIIDETADPRAATRARAVIRLYKTQDAPATAREFGRSKAWLYLSAEAVLLHGPESILRGCTSHGL